jgi:hypothetical protein
MTHRKNKRKGPKIYSLYFLNKLFRVFSLCEGKGTTHVDWDKFIDRDLKGKGHK